MNYCDESPIKNVTVQAIQVNVNNGFNESGYSDANGDFEILVSTSEKPNYRFMNLQEEVPLETVDYGNIPLYSNSNIYYRVKINNPHTVSDTLWMVDPSNTSQFIKMYGPFHDTLFGNKTITCVNVLSYNAHTKQINNTNTSNTVTTWYKINRINYYSTKAVQIQANICNAVADTLTLIVD
jgi:hypothetical protein